MIEKIDPIFRNIAKTEAKFSKLKLKDQNIYTQVLLNVKTSTTHHAFKLIS